MARKAAKAKSRVKSKKARKAKARKTKVAAKKKVAKKTAARKRAPLKEAPARSSVPAARAPRPAALADDEAKTLAVAGVVDRFFGELKKTIKPNEPLLDSDKVSMFKLGNTGIVAALGVLRSELDPPFTLTITPALARKCSSADETIGDLKRDTDNATTRAPVKPAPIAAEVKLVAAEAAALGDDEAKTLAVTECVDDFFGKEKKKIKPTEPLKDSDKVSMFKLGEHGVLAVLGLFRAILKNNKPHSFTLTITPALKEKCSAGDETIGQMISDIDEATTRP